MYIGRMGGKEPYRCSIHAFHTQSTIVIPRQGHLTSYLIHSDSMVELRIARRIRIDSSRTARNGIPPLPTQCSRGCKLLRLLVGKHENNVRVIGLLQIEDFNGRLIGVSEFCTGYMRYGTYFKAIAIGNLHRKLLNQHLVRPNYIYWIEIRYLLETLGLDPERTPRRLATAEVHSDIVMAVREGSKQENVWLPALGVGAPAYV